VKGGKKREEKRERGGRKKARKVYGYFHEDMKKQYYFLFEKFKRQYRYSFWKIILSPTMLHMDFFLFVQVASFSSQTLKGIL